MVVARRGQVLPVGWRHRMERSATDATPSGGRAAVVRPVPGAGPSETSSNGPAESLAAVGADHSRPGASASAEARSPTGRRPMTDDLTIDEPAHRSPGAPVTRRPAPSRSARPMDATERRTRVRPLARAGAVDARSRSTGGTRPSEGGRDGAAAVREPVPRPRGRARPRCGGRRASSGGPCRVVPGHRWLGDQLVPRRRRSADPSTTAPPPTIPPHPPGRIRASGPVIQRVVKAIQVGKKKKTTKYYTTLDTKENVSYFDNREGALALESKLRLAQEKEKAKTTAPVTTTASPVNGSTASAKTATPPVTTAPVSYSGALTGKPSTPVRRQRRTGRPRHHHPEQQAGNVHPRHHRLGHEARILHRRHPHSRQDDHRAGDRGVDAQSGQADDAAGALEGQAGRGHGDDGAVRRAVPRPRPVRLVAGSRQPCLRVQGGAEGAALRQASAVQPAGFRHRRLPGQRHPVSASAQLRRGRRTLRRRARSSARTIPR